MDNKVLVPSYYDKFACLGGECKYTCCQEWGVAVGKRDYKELMKQRCSPELRAKLRSFVGKVKDETFDEVQNYARLRFGEDRVCTFLTPEGFCDLQIQCGAGVLPGTCRDFPRGVNIISNVYEANMRLSCEATARLLVETTEPMSFDVVLDHPFVRQGPHLLSPSMLEINPLIHHYWSIKALSIRVLQNRFYTITGRILYVGVILKRLMEYEETGRLTDVELLLQGLMEQEDSETLRNSLDKLPTDTEAAIQISTKLSHLSNIKGFSDLYLRAINTIGKYNEEDDSVTINTLKYQQAREKFAAFCEKNPQVMENISVALFHEMGMPFGGINFGNIKTEKLNIWDNYLFFCWKIVLIQFVLGALVTPETTLHEVALMVSIVARQFPTKTAGAKIYLGWMEDMQVTTPERLSILLKG